MQSEWVEAGRIDRAKAAYSTRRVAIGDIATLVTGEVRPEAGDVVLATVKQIGHHTGLELRDGRKAALFPGDEILVVYGNRYAPDQFEAEVCDDLGECDLVAAGGVAACVMSRHERTRKATRIVPVGLAGDAHGRPINLRGYALPPIIHPKTAEVYAVFGSAMNAGKTTTAVSVIRGLRAAGRRVAAAKVTGTGAGGDFWVMNDAGADPVLDFTAAGLVSTYKVGETELLRTLSTLTGHAMRAGVDALVLEVADGLYQHETALLARSAEFQGLVDGVFFAARDALGAAAGVDRLARQGFDVLALSGTMTQSPLAVQEATEATGLPVLTPADLAEGTMLRELMARVETGGNALVRALPAPANESLAA